MSPATAIAFTLALAASAGVRAEEPKGDAEAAKNNKIAVCEGCHGIAGYRTAYPVVYHVPKLGGQQRGYIVRALQAYKAGERSHPSMRGIARSLSEQDMADIAAYYSESGK